MKILFDCHVPFQLAHGGMQIQVERTVEALRGIGVECEWLRWWDAAQTGDIIHFTGRLNSFYLHFAKAKGLKVVILDLLTSQGSRKAIQRVPHWCLRQADRLAGGRLGSRFGWDSYRLADALIANTGWEAHLLQVMYGADPKKIHIVPNGVEDVFFQKVESGKRKAERNDWLVCVASITERKRVLEMAEAASRAGTPLCLIGKPYSESDPYYRRFVEVVRASQGIVKFEGEISNRAEMAEIYLSAHGFVLLSAMETRSLSAEEAAAAGCPLLLSDLPWARSTFGDTARYCPIAGPQETSLHMRRFYDSRATLPIPARPATWRDVAERLREIYGLILQ